MKKTGMPTKIGFVGFGQVAMAFSQALSEHGAHLFAYDVLLEQDGGKGVLQRRAEGTGVGFCTLTELIARVDWVLCAAQTQAAVEIATACAPFLRPGQIYVDLNSTSPAVKVEIGRIIDGSPADFVEGAILGAVSTGGAAVRILVGGVRGPEAALGLAQLGLNVSFYSAEIGQASTFKMLRSIFSKGLEALLIELLVTARRAGIETDLWDEIVGVMRRHPFEQTASDWVRTHAVAHQRRYHEMVQVVETMREIGVEPVMAAATEAFFERSVALGLSDAFAEAPSDMAPVIAFMNQRL